MWSKYKFYIIGIVAVGVGVLVYLRASKKQTADSVIETANEDQSSKLKMSTVSGNKTSDWSLIRGLAYGG